MISHRYQCIFIHIPKTGGASIERLIWPSLRDRNTESLWSGFVDDYHNKYQTGGLQHLTARFVLKEVGDKVFNEYYKFSVIRNPWDKAVSQYRYMLEKREDLMVFIGMTKKTTFKEYLHLISKKPHVQWMSQTDFLVDVKGEYLINNIIRFENLQSDFQTVGEQLGLESITLPHWNKSRRQSYHSYYDDESIQMVGKLYESDIERFSYSYDNNIVL